MNPDLSLAVVGSLAAFLLRTMLAFGVCLILSRLFTAAGHRFILWAGFLYGSAGYWLYLASKLIPAKQSPISFLSVPSPHSAVVPSAWTIPQSWAFPLSIGLCLLGLVYGLVLACMLVAHARKLRHLRWVVGFATEPPKEIAEIVESLATSLGVRPPRLLMLAGSSSPATFGWLRPVILLPTLCVEQDRSDLEDILLHELHHVRRMDSFWNALAIAARGIVCFHPAAWYSMRKLQFDRELACDLAVVSRSPARRSMYAESLLRFARLNLAQEPAGWGIDFAASSEHLTIRVHSILTEARKRPAWMSWLRTGLGIALLATFAGVAPSLGVLLGYKQPPVTQSNVSTIPVSPVDVVKAKRTARRQRTLLSPAETPTQFAEADSQTTAPSPNTGMKAGSEAEQKPVLPTGSGPQLQRRTPGAAASGSSKQQSIALINDGDSGQNGKHGERAQTIEQSATVAAAIYKRLGDLDRH